MARIGYARVSTTDQDLAIQLEALTAASASRRLGLRCADEDGRTFQAIWSRPKVRSTGHQQSRRG